MSFRIVKAQRGGKNKQTNKNNTVLVGPSVFWRMDINPNYLLRVSLLTAVAAGLVEN